MVNNGKDVVMEETDLQIAKDIERKITKLRQFLYAADHILKHPADNYGVHLKMGCWGMISTIDFYPEFTEKAVRALVKVTEEILQIEEEKLRKL